MLASLHQDDVSAVAAFCKWFSVMSISIAWFLNDWSRLANHLSEQMKANLMILLSHLFLSLFIQGLLKCLSVSKMFSFVLLNFKLNLKRFPVAKGDLMLRFVCHCAMFSLALLKSK